jgi:hypothetical protein
MPTTASGQEVLWSLMALPGLLMSAYNVHGAIGDLRQHWTDGLRPVGWIGLAKVAIVLGMALLVLVSGVIAMLTPEPIRPELQDAVDTISSILLCLDFLILALAVAFAIERAYVVPHIHPARERGRA